MILSCHILPEEIQNNIACFSECCGNFKGKVMQIEKALINDQLPVSEVSWKFCIPTNYNFGVIYKRNWLFS